MSNNTSETNYVLVNDLNTVDVYVGDPTRTSASNYPYYTYKESCITEILYTEEQIGTTGELSSIGFISKNNADVEDVFVKIWLGHTDLTNIKDSIIPASELELVFEDSI